ncbi:uncharacterized protein N7482_007716 [Penicillium canariense]|uniref:CRAL/TRIO N-terminal domain-containing protein n=1 Tax=Penicillium canariense TaxID=189055 RepID=A0A9W9LJE7_9EURO|nr:uncharacterized protein N7482_007716 [Penicillium canariense]KAJ5160712.1 hypothetical protein N7482_007716 [Penicillium canariense]
MAAPPECDESLTTVMQLCAERDLLTRPEGLETHIHRRFLTARRFDPDAALKQFQEASQFRREKHIVKLYDMVEITDFEQARQFHPH